MRNENGKVMLPFYWSDPSFYLTPGHATPPGTFITETSISFPASDAYLLADTNHMISAFFIISLLYSTKV